MGARGSCLFGAIRVHGRPCRRGHGRARAAAGARGTRRATARRARASASAGWRSPRRRRGPDVAWRARRARRRAGRARSGRSTSWAAGHPRRRRAGAIYLDSTGEPPFIRSVYEWFGPGGGAAPARRCSPRSATTTCPACCRGAGAAGRGSRPPNGWTSATSSPGRRAAASPAAPCTRWWGSRSNPASVRRRGGACATSPRARGCARSTSTGRPRPGLASGRASSSPCRCLAPRPAGGGRLPRLASAGRCGAHVRDHVAGRTAVRAPGTAAWSLADLRDPPRARRSRRGGAGGRDRRTSWPRPSTPRAPLLARTRLRAPEPYAITADLLAWGARSRGRARRRADRRARRGGGVRPRRAGGGRGGGRDRRRAPETSAERAGRRAARGLGSYSPRRGDGPAADEPSPAARRPVAGRPHPHARSGACPAVALLRRLRSRWAPS